MATNLATQHELWKSWQYVVNKALEGVCWVEQVAYVAEYRSERGRSYQWLVTLGSPIHASLVEDMEQPEICLTLNLRSCIIFFRLTFEAFQSMQ